MDLNYLINNFVNEPFIDINNFNLAYKYESLGHTAAAVSYYLRCAEFTDDDDLSYECLLRMSLCISKQKNRDEKELYCIKHAISIKPERPEALYIMSLYHSFRKKWLESYMYACLGLENTDKEYRPFKQDIEYSEKYQLLFQKAYSGFNKGKIYESRDIYMNILHSYDIPDYLRNIILKNINELPSPSHPIIPYTKDKEKKLKYDFQNYNKINENFSQIYQDIFTLSMNDGKKYGTYLEIGSGHFKTGNNTFLLETQYNWKGISIDINEQSISIFNSNRKNKGICADATSINYSDLLSQHYESKNIDYLQLDCDPPNITYDILQKIPFDTYKFGVITYEHDYYNDETGSFREKSRKILNSHGYKLICGNVSPLKDKYPFEDWWIHPELIDENIWKIYERQDDIPINGEKYMLTNKHFLSNNYKNFISIGGWCGAKIALKKLGLFDEASLPFDDVRSSMKGIIDCFENNFENYFPKEIYEDNRSLNCPHFIGEYIGFYHDNHNLLDINVIESFKRKIVRFDKKIKKNNCIFIRTICREKYDDEIKQYKNLQFAIDKKYPNISYIICFIIPNQVNTQYYKHIDNRTFLFTLNDTSLDLFDGIVTDAYKPIFDFIMDTNLFVNIPEPNVIEIIDAPSRLWLVQPEGHPMVNFIKEKAETIIDNKHVAFWDNQLCERGTTVAMYDYAYYNQTILGNKSYIFYDKNNPNNKKEIIEKFKKHFVVHETDDFKEVDEYIVEYNISHIYIIKSGEYDSKLSKVAKNCVHCVFICSEPHGEVYSSISTWVHGNDNKYPVVPHMVNLPKNNNNMRKKLNIPKNGIVYGAYEGKENFNIKFVQNVVYTIAQNNDNIYFLFANFYEFCQDLPNIIFLPMITNLQEKVEFINTCDAMLWARLDGEVMSMSMGEFSILNKPIICKDIGINRGHVHLLKDKAIWYNDEKDLTDILLNFNPEVERKKDWNAYKDYTPEKVMKIFDDVFLKDNVINNKVFIEKIIKKKYNLSEGWKNMTKNLRNYLENKDIDMYKIENIEPHIFHWPETSDQNKIQLDLLSKDKNSKFYKTIINNNDFGPKGINLYKGVQLDRVQQVWSIYNMVEILNLNLEKDEKILEFGGGTGQLADVLKDLKFKGKHIVYDLPLMICLQKHFVEKKGKIKCNYIFDDEKLEIINGTNYLPCNQIDCEKEIMIMDNINFIATFSLTETDIETHKKFLEYMENFSRIYIVYSTDKSITEDYIDNHAYILEIIEKIKDTHKYFIRDFRSNAKAFYAVKKLIGIKAENNIQNIWKKKNEYMIGMDKGIFSDNDKINSPKIIDCFIFYNELDLLTYRLNLLNNYVDYFVLVEATHTHIGKEKNLFYNENKHLYEKFKDKIIHIVVDDLPFKYPNIDISKNQQWRNENFQRNCIKRGIDELLLEDNDVIVICDLDEIPNPEVFKEIKDNKRIVTKSSLKMEMYYYSLNYKTKINDWVSGKIISYQEFNDLDSTIHDFRYTNLNNIENGGWHLSFFGDKEFIENKIKNYAHQEFNNDEILSTIDEKINFKKDLFNRENHEIQHINIEDNGNLPPLYEKYLTNFYKKKKKKNINELYDFVPCHDQIGNDLERIDLTHHNIEEIIDNNTIGLGREIVAINTQGYIKSHITKIEQIPGRFLIDSRANSDGIYIKKTIDNTLQNISKKSIPVLGTLVCTTTKWIEKQLESIDYPIENFIIINNNTEYLSEKLDKIVSKGHKFIMNLKVYHMPYNLGCAEGWNTIIKSFVHSPYWVVTNDDVSFTPGFLKELHYKALENYDVGLIHGKPCYLNYLEKMGSFDLFLIRDWVVKDYGLFDVNYYPAYFEDFDYMFRLLNKPVKIINKLEHKYYHGNTFDYNISGGNTAKYSDKLSYKLINIRYKNFYYFFKKWNICPESITSDNIKNIYQYPFNKSQNSLSLTYDIDFIREKQIDNELPSKELKNNTLKNNKFKINSSLIKNTKSDLIVIDNFYADPDKVRNYALSLEYQPPENHGAVGYRCENGRKIYEGTKEVFEKLLDTSISNGTDLGEWDYSTNGCFQWCDKEVPIVYHCDSQQYAAIIYLTPDAPPSCGTSFLRHKKYKIRNSSIYDKPDWNMQQKNLDAPHLNKENWETVDSIGNVYNRLVIFNAQYIHSVSEYFGEDITNSRLFQLFFFNLN